MGSILGTPRFADECTTKQRRISYAWINVEIDVTRELAPTVAIIGVDGKTFQQWEGLECVPVTTRLVNPG